jgi:general secretion pathway protein C
MKKLSNYKIVSVLATLITLVLIAKMISLAIWWYLPSDGVELNDKKSYQAKYQRVDFRNMLNSPKVAKSISTKTTTSSYSINNLILKGLYGSRFNGYAIVAKKSSPSKTSIIAIGEEYAGYKLKEIGLDRVLFSKNSKDYELKLETTNKFKGSNAVKRVKDDFSDSQKSVSREDINYYSKNPSQIWKDIAISEVKKNGKIDGFEVKRIRPNSKMAELGLKKGDIILKVNNVKLSSYRDAIKIYQNIGKIDSVEIVVKRDNQEKEIVYEIN